MADTKRLSMSPTGGIDEYGRAMRGVQAGMSAGTWETGSRGQRIAFMEDVLVARIEGNGIHMKSGRACPVPEIAEREDGSLSFRMGMSDRSASMLAERAPQAQGKGMSRGEQAARFLGLADGDLSGGYGADGPDDGRSL